MKEKGLIKEGNAHEAIAVILLVYVLISLCQCTLHVGVDWRGETEMDKREFTNKSSK